MTKRLTQLFLFCFITIITVGLLQVFSSSAVAVTPDYFVYDDTLFWDDWSWNTTVNLSVTSPVFAGTKSMSVKYNAGWAGLSLRNSGFTTSPYTHLQFYVFPAGISVPDVKAVLYNSSGPIKGVSIKSYSTSLGTGWYRITIPLADLGGSNTTITRVTLQEYTGSSQPTFYIDSLGFINQATSTPTPTPTAVPTSTPTPTPTLTPSPTPTPTTTPSFYFVYDDSLHWSDWSWNTNVNPNTSSPVFAGAKSMAVTYASGWAGLSLHTSGFDTSPYSHLSFTIRLGGQSLSAISVSLYNSTGGLIKQVNPQPYASDVGNGWFRVVIPLTDLGGNRTTITCVQLQEYTGNAQPTFYVDDLKFTDQGAPLPDKTLPLVPQPGPLNKVLPSFIKPFKGDFALLNFFDHDLPDQWSTGNGFQLTWWNLHAKPEVDGHNAVDWLLPDGTPLLAVADGVVTRAGIIPPFYCHHFNRDVFDSLAVDIQYDAPGGESFRISYGHLSRADVAVGQLVKTGQQIGLSGHSGCAKVPHVHFFVERRTNTNSGFPRPIDPYGWEATQSDPWQQHPEGAQSLWLWKTGEAPSIYREERRLPNSNPNESAPVSITVLRWTGWKDNDHPNNEFVQLELDPVYAPSGTYDLSGFSIKNNKGDTFKIPSGTIIKQNVPVHIFTGSGTNTSTDLYWGLTNGIWDDMGDCAKLLRADNTTMSKFSSFDTLCN